jgi:hypothetical protein
MIANNVCLNRSSSSLFHSLCCRHIEGRLRILSDPDSYVARLAKEAAIQQEKARRAALEAKASELNECTFHPVTNDAPEYVKRIAQSMALARAVRPQDPSAQKPDWR